MRLRLLDLGFLVFAFVGLAGNGWAQTTGTIFGVVEDESAAVMPGVTVTVRNLDTGFTRVVVTAADGAYRAPSLPLGSYEVKAELAGFQTAVRTGIVLTVGREAQVNIALAVGDLAETLVVTGEAPLINTQSAAMSEVVDTKQIQDLPLNARDFIQLATLQPGVAIVQTAPQGSPQGGQSGAVGRGLGVRLTVSGARSNSNSFLLDGTDVNDYANTTPGSITGANLGVEAIREFRVLTNTFSAEYGRSAGAVITAVSRSGTNEYHGSVFEFHRNDNMDAESYATRRFGTVPPTFRRDQFGGALGGPVVRDRIFFFANYEGNRTNSEATSVSTVLTQAAREGDLSAALGGPVTVHPGIRPVLDVFPLPNGAIRGDVGDYVVTNRTDIAEDFIVGKIDHQVSAKHGYFVRHTFSDARIQAPDSLGINRNDASSRRQFTTFDWKSVLSSRLLNSTTFALNRTLVSSGDQTSLVAVPAIPFIPGRNMGNVNVSGLSGFPGGPGTADHDFFDYRIYQVRNDVTWSLGRQDLRFGFNLEQIHLDMDGTQRENGLFSFGSIRNFLLNRPQNFEGQVPGSDTARRFRQGLYSFYAQDDFRVRRNLTINAGVRYEFITEIAEEDGKISSLRNFLDPAFTPGRIFVNPSLKNFAPRLGVAWDPTGTGRTAVRGGVGLYHDQILTHYISGGYGIRVPPSYSFANLNEALLAVGDFPSNAYDKFVTSGLIGTAVEWFEYEPSQPYGLQFNANVQHQLPGELVVMAGYVGYRGENLKRTSRDGNIRVPEVLPDGRLFFNHASKVPCPIAVCVDTPRRNPAFTAIRTHSLDAQSRYHGMQLGLTKRFKQGLQMQASYTLGKNEDHASTVFNVTEFPNSNSNPYFWDRDFNWGPSDIDVRHNLMLNYTYAIPGKIEGVLGRILNGWQSSGILRVSSGQPYSVHVTGDAARTLGVAPGQRPSVPEGHSGTVESTGDPDGWFDRNQFVFPEVGFLGNLQRHTGTGDGIISFDTAISKNINFTADRYLQVRAELFNAFNTDNFNNPGSPSVFDAQGRVIATAGRITNTSIRNRQAQVSLKFYF